jgi:DmsE family decaheme c-type cytochrome
MGNAGRRMLVAVLILTVVAAVVALPSLLQSQVKPPANVVPKTTPADFIGAETCKTCHEDAFEQFSATTMGKLFLKHPRSAKEALGCESCHGSGRAHAESGGTSFEGLITFAKKDPTPVVQRNAVCLGCHEKTARLHWQGSPHELRDLACTNCHRVMENISERSQLAKATEIETCGQCHLERRAQLMRSSHMPLREGKMTCTNCHNPHGTVTESLLKANSVNENCYTCHAEKRGPFLWEHPPVTESCSNCHEPHGSNHEALLKLSKPRLCQLCHVETRHPTRPQDPQSRFVFNRSCSNCHSEVHGSNHPSGRSFTR